MLFESWCKQLMIETSWLRKNLDSEQKQLDSPLIGEMRKIEIEPLGLL